MNLGLLHLPSPPMVMGVLHLSNGSSVEQIISTGQQMLQQGAAIIGLGVEPFRPGNEKNTVQQELDLVMPAIEFLVKRLAIPLAIETSNPEVMSAAVGAGAKMIHDAISLTKPGALNMALKLNVPVCLMHMQTDPGIMRIEPGSQDYVTSIFQYLEQRLAACVSAGFDRSKLMVDPGLGYGKNLQQNISILRFLEVFKKLQYPLQVSFSNNSMIGQILDVGVEGRAYGSVAAAVIAAGKGADIIRVQNVQAIADALKVFTSVAGL